MFAARRLINNGLKTHRFSHYPHNTMAPSLISFSRAHPPCLSTTRTTTSGVQGRTGQLDVKLETGRRPVTIRKLAHLNHEWMLEVHWGDGSEEKFPYIWLRDNCQCLKCFHRTARHRTVLLEDLDISITPISVEVNEAGNGMEIDWSDGHRGYYTADWLSDRSFTESKRENNRQNYRSHHSYWGSDMIARLPKADFSDLMQEDDALLEFLQNLEEFGLVIVQKAQRRLGEVITLTNRVGYLKETHYGTTFSVKQKIDANNLAYTSASLNLHVDLPYMAYKPGVQLLHCISQVPTEGGDNHFVDSFHAANQLREKHPNKFHLLATVPVDFTDMGVEENSYNFHTLNREPMIIMDQQGLISTVNFNQMVRDSYFDIPVEEVREWYDAMLTFSKLFYHKDNIITYKMEEGEIAVFDNNRVLHGRVGYHMTSGVRELEGCYWDWDAVKSCRRVLHTKYGLKE